MGDLVPVREIRVEVVFAIEVTDALDLAAEGEAEARGEVHRARVHGGKRAGERGVEGSDVRVHVAAVIAGGAARRGERSTRESPRRGLEGTRGNGRGEPRGNRGGGRANAPGEEFRVERELDVQLQAHDRLPPVVVARDVRDGRGGTRHPTRARRDATRRREVVTRDARGDARRCFHRAPKRTPRRHRRWRDRGRAGTTEHGVGRTTMLVPELSRAKP